MALRLTRLLYLCKIAILSVSCHHLYGFKMTVFNHYLGAFMYSRSQYPLRDNHLSFL